MSAGGARTIFLALLTIFGVASLCRASGISYLVKDINPNGFSSPEFLTKVGDRLFFNADDGVHGQELWVSDGTEAGTYMVIDLIPGPDGSIPQRIVELNGKAVFQVDDNIDGMQWYISDGTELGTVSIGNVHEGGPGIDFGVCGFWGYYAEGTGNAVFFIGQDAAHGSELWKTNGTSGGTTLVKDIFPGPTWATIQSLVNVDGSLYFSAAGLRLWKSDGTSNGTIQLTQEATAILTAGSGGLAYFQGKTADAGEELWVSDGTPQGTHLVKDINPGSPNSSPFQLTDVNGTLFFTAFTPAEGRELWRSDGTDAGTSMVVDLSPSAGGGIWEMANFGEILLFIRYNPDAGWQLWRSDGTSAGTVLVRTIAPGTVMYRPEFLTLVNGRMFFSADDGIHGEELWVSDGTPEGTFMTADANPGPDGLSPSLLVGVGNKVFFVGVSPASGGPELFAYDATIPIIPATNSELLTVLCGLLVGAGILIVRSRLTQLKLRDVEGR